MPRIPIRVEPYSSPSRQHRHYKNKRDQVLRALGKAAYINGSHFAIMWVSARGGVETYASEALQDRLDDWFVKGGIAEEAKELVKGNPDPQRPNPFFEGVENLSDDEGLADDSLDRSGLPSLATPTGEEDPFLDASRSSPMRYNRRAIVPLDTNVANELYLRSRDIEVRQGSMGLGLDTNFSQPPKSAPLPSNDFRDALLNGPRTSTLNQRLSLSRMAFSSNTPQVDVRLKNEAARTAFLEFRFGQLQQGVCKTVSKAWIKIIEPKKQTRCPYNKGEEGKPTWWPEGVRHKEPDHLMKPERHSLLLAILRSPKVQVARLQLATAEVVALIKANKVSLLMDVYRIAREEEKMREAKVDINTPMTIAVSTLDGWSDAEQGPTSDGLHLTRSVSPESNEKASVSISARKRNLAKAMSRSASTSVMMNKRRSIAVPGNVPEAMARTNSASNLPGNRSMGDSVQDALRQQQQAAYFAASVAAASVAAASGHPQYAQNYQQVHGLVTPLSSSAQLMGPGYMSASGDNYQYNDYAMYYPEHRASASSIYGYPQANQEAPATLGFPSVPVPNESEWQTMPLDLTLQQHWQPNNAEASFNTSFESAGPRTPSPALRLNLQEREKLTNADLHNCQGMIQNPNSVNFDAWVRSQQQ